MTMVLPNLAVAAMCVWVASLRPALNIVVIRDGAECDMWPVPKSAELTFTRAGSCCGVASPFLD